MGSLENCSNTSLQKWQKLTTVVKLFTHETTKDWPCKKVQVYVWWTVKLPNETIHFHQMWHYSLKWCAWLQMCCTRTKRAGMYISGPPFFSSSCMLMCISPCLPSTDYRVGPSWQQDIPVLYGCQRPHLHKDVKQSVWPRTDHFSCSTIREMES